MTSVCTFSNGNSIVCYPLYFIISFLFGEAQPQFTLWDWCANVSQDSKQHCAAKGQLLSWTFFLSFLALLSPSPFSLSFYSFSHPSPSPQSLTLPSLFSFKLCSYLLLVHIPEVATVTEVELGSPEGGVRVKEHVCAWTENECEITVGQVNTQKHMCSQGTVEVI